MKWFQEWRKERYRRGVRKQLVARVSAAGGRTLGPWEETVYSNYLVRIAPTWPWSLNELMDAWAIWWTRRLPQRSFRDLLVVAMATNVHPTDKARDIASARND